VIGAKVLLEMFEKYNDQWVVEMLFPHLYDWLNFFLTYRREQPRGWLVCHVGFRQPLTPFHLHAGLICLGSGPSGDSHNMQVRHVSAHVLRLLTAWA